jgi:hypothetical protein
MREAKAPAPSKAILPANAEAQKTLPGVDSSVSERAQPLILTGTLVGRNLTAALGTNVVYGTEDQGEFPYIPAVSPTHLLGIRGTTGESDSGSREKYRQLVAQVASTLVVVGDSHR